MSSVVTILLLALHLSPWMMIAVNPLEPMTVSLQVRFPNVPYYISTRRGDFVKLGLDLTDIVYPSGIPQVQAAIDNKAWDVGVAGAVPAIVGGQQGILNIAIASDDSATTQMVATKDVADDWPPASLEGLTVAVTPNSTGHYVVEACLAAYNISLATFKFAPQDACVEALHPASNGSEPTAQIGGLWSPYTHRFLDHSEGSQMLCDGHTVYKTVTSDMMVRQEFADAKPELVTKFLAGWLRGIAFMKNESNRDQVLAYIDDYYTNSGGNLTHGDAVEDFETFGFFDLDQQVEEMTRAVGSPPYSNYDVWTIDISDFLVANQILLSYPEPSTYITDRFLQIIKNNPILRRFARGEDVDVEHVVIEVMMTTTSTATMVRCFIGGWVVLLFGMIGWTI